MKKLGFIVTLFFFAIIMNAQTTLDTAQNFAVKDIYGNTLDLFEILDEGKIVVIDFFSTTWESCQLYAPEMQVSYETFGCNDGNVFFLGIDNTNTNSAVFEFDSIYGVHYPGVSGQQGGGNAVHLQYLIQATPSIVVITPDKLIVNQQIYPPSTTNVVTAITNAGGIQQPCLTSIDEIKLNDILTIGPNPVRNVASLSIFLEEAKNLELEIFNLTGQKLVYYKPTLYNSGSNLLKADLTGLSDGIYMVILRDDNRILSTKKLILLK